MLGLHALQRATHASHNRFATAHTQHSTAHTQTEVHIQKEARREHGEEECNLRVCVREERDTQRERERERKSESERQ